MAKKKKDEIAQLDEKLQELGTSLEEVVEQNQANFGVNEIYPLNGKGVGLYFDEEAKRYVLVTLDLSPESDSAVITSKKVLRSSKLGATLESEMLLKKLIQKEIK